jgi:hypothetical protein
MPRNMGASDRGLRAFLVAPVAIVAAVLLGASTLGGVILFVVAGNWMSTLPRCGSTGWTTKASSS